MLFHAPHFLFAFLPVVWLGFLLCRRRGRPALVRGWLVLASLAFYAAWMPLHLGVLLGSLVANFFLARAIAASPPGRRRRRLLGLGVGFDLALLGVFKYAGFLAENLGLLTGLETALPAIALPLAISFFTFQQIAFLVDVARDRARPGGFIDYALFVSFFPQLIAGPIVHHREMFPQLSRLGRGRLSAEQLSLGLALLAIGLFKKMVLADSLAIPANAGFDAAAAGTTLSFLEAWGATLAYALQLYFDFSGYSDMALGLGRLFGVRLPENFDSPYRAASVIDFWRRWHITLSRFLRDYLYLPLGGSRRGPLRQARNLSLTFLLGGLWHGAGWTFVVWGGLHGLLLIANHGWRGLHSRLGWQRSAGRLGHGAARLLTLTVVVLAWVPFRAANLETAGRMLGSLFGGAGFSLPGAAALLLGPLAPWLEIHGVAFGGAFFNGLTNWPDVLPVLIVASAVALAAPSSRRWIEWLEAALTRPARGPGWSHEWGLGVSLGALGFFVLTRWFTAAPSEFLYFQF